MSNLSFTILDTSNIDDIVQYEKALFRAFYGSDDPTLRQIWDIDKETKRIKMKIDYHDQEILVAKLHNSIVAGVAINYNMSEQLQLEMLGFSIYKSENNICEGLALFNLQVFQGSNPIALLLRDFTFEKLREKNIIKTYGTTSKKNVRGYQILGWKVIDFRDICEHRKFLMEITL